MRIYSQKKHNFFEQLVTFMTSYVTIGLGLIVQHHGKMNRFKQRQFIVIRGRPNVSNLEFKFFPYSLFQSLYSKKWPQQLKFHDRPITTQPENIFKIPVRLQGTGRFTAYLIMSTFVHYFESIRPLVKSKYGGQQNWPPTWNFGRVVRNAFAHGGKIKIDNPNATPVAWKNLSYTYNENGRQIIYRDITPVEMVLLMEEMDATV
jgi:hypothetical protein